jgi:glycosyltransferase involved in cell wall biosynthesis
VRGAGLPAHVPTAVVPAIVPQVPSVASNDGPPRRLGFIGRLAEEKGLDVLLQAMGHLRDCSLGLTVVGDGAMRGPSERLARELDLDVTFVGGVEPGEVLRWLPSFDVLVVPSVPTHATEEQFGRILVEGMASGVPIVTTRVGAQPDVVGDAAMLVPPRDAAALANAIRALVDDESGSRKLAAAGVQRYQAHYAPDALASRIVTVWAQALSALPSGPCM